MTGLLLDVRYALRQVRKSPGFAATAILVLALGLGTSTGMLAIVQSVLMRPLNYRESDRVMLVGVSDQANATSNISYPDFQEMKRSLHQFEDLGAYSSVPLAVQTPDGAQMLVAPAVGALFSARWIRSFLFGTTAHDPLAYAWAGALVLLASSIAIFVACPPGRFHWADGGATNRIEASQ